MLHERFINLYRDKEKKRKKCWTFFLLFEFWVKKDLDPDPDPQLCFCANPDQIGPVHSKFIKNPAIIRKIQKQYESNPVASILKAKPEKAVKFCSVSSKTLFYFGYLPSSSLILKFGLIDFLAAGKNDLSQRWIHWFQPILCMNLTWFFGCGSGMPIYCKHMDPDSKRYGSRTGGALARWRDFDYLTGS